MHRRSSRNARRNKGTLPGCRRSWVRHSDSPQATSTSLAAPTRRVKAATDGCVRINPTLLARTDGRRRTHPRRERWTAIRPGAPRHCAALQRLAYRRRLPNTAPYGYRLAADRRARWNCAATFPLC
jgi:hypothetical protein